MSETDSNTHKTGFEIAVIGMACRFPGAKNIDEFWQNLRDGVESISFFTDDEIADEIGFKPAFGANYVKAGGVLEGAEMFDAAFFGYNPREAETMDPQHRLFLECSWQALENAGYDSARYEGPIGVYAGASTNSYLISSLAPKIDLIEMVGEFQVSMGNSEHYLATRVSYKLNLKGPSINVQTACSTSLVAIHLANQGLLSGECDMALAGGVSVTVPQKLGYFYEPGGVNSPDGHCRAFDEKAEGTVGGNGIGVVVLKRLEDALQDGDTIYAVIKGSAINNDGSMKVGYTAPSVEGQSKVIRAAHVMAEIEPESIEYIEAHGTGTALGDPIEITALTKVFQASTEKKNYCAVGTVKSNFGHLDAAAGVAGFIKTVLALKHEMIPPSLHFTRPNPNLDLLDTPFYINAQLQPWAAADLHPRRAGVSAFGIGGTNAHLILEQAPACATTQADTTLTAAQPHAAADQSHLLVLSAKSPAALEAASHNLAEFLGTHPEVDLRDVSYTLQVGRRAFPHRRMVVAPSLSAARAALTGASLNGTGGVYDERNYQEEREVPVAFMFPGGGAGYAGMGRGLYGKATEYTRQIDLCSQILAELLGFDLRDLLLAEAGRREEVQARLQGTRAGLPGLFVVEYALAQQLMAWGIKPEVMIGHSLGEYVAATVAGIFKLEDALRVVESRGRLMEQMRKGGMLGVSLSEAEARAAMAAGMSLAAVNGPQQCVMSGEVEAIERMAAKLEQQGVENQRVRIEVAAHSEMVEEIREEFEGVMRGMEMKEPEIEIISNVTGRRMKGEEGRSAAYWGRHLRETVRYGEGIEEVLKEKSRVLVEVGPGQGLSSLVRMARGYERGRGVVGMMRHAKEEVGDEEALKAGLGRLWVRGVEMDWEGMGEGEKARRIGLPTYPFEKQKFWIDCKFIPQNKNDSRNVRVSKKGNIAAWFYLPVWKQSLAPLPVSAGDLVNETSCWLVFADAFGIGSRIAKRLEAEGQEVITVVEGQQFARLSHNAFEANPRDPEDYESVLQLLASESRTPNKVIHLWSVTSASQTASKFQAFEKAQETGFYSLIQLAQALGKQSFIETINFEVISNHLQKVNSSDLICPEKATLLGPCKVIPQEYPNIICRSIDVIVSGSDSEHEALAEQLVAEVTAKASNLVVAYRGNDRWVESYEAMRVEGGAKKPRLRQSGVYLITGGLGLIGLDLAEHLARKFQARLALIGRSAFPSNDGWAQWLETHDEQDSISQKIRRLQSLEESGAEVLVINADVAEPQDMRRAVDQTRERFGALHGVIHGAGIFDRSTFLPIQEIGRAECKRHFQPKVQGVLSLSEALQDVEFDFCLLLSSVASVLGGLGFVGYSAANLFLDAFAHEQNTRRVTRWVSANWDGWQRSDSADIDASMGNAGASLAGLIMTPQEGAEVFERVLSMGTAPQVVISTGDLQARINTWIKLTSLRPEQEDAPTAGYTLYKRPDMEAAYAPASNDFERKLVEIWQQVLGIDQIGIHDNFFELGGHSLLAIRLISRLREGFQVEVSLTNLFQSPTVAGLAVAIVQAQARQFDQDLLAQVLAELEEVPADNAQG